MSIHVRSIRRWAGILSLASCSSLFASGHPASDHDRDDREPERQSWLTAGRDSNNSHSNPLEFRLSRESVPKLKPKWVFDTAGDISATPTVERNAVYVPDWGGYIYKIDNRTGKAIWSHKVSEYTGLSNSLSRNSPAITEDLLIFGDQASPTLMAVNKHNGELVWKTVLDANAEAIITNSPLVIGDRIFVGVASNEEGVAARDRNYKLSFRGSVSSVDLRSGSVLWRFNTVPEGYTGGAVWGSTFAYDARRESLYITTGNNYSVPDSVEGCLKSNSSSEGRLSCLSSKDYIDAVIALHPETGKPKWVRRLGGFDAWIVSCSANLGGNPCPDPSGPDYDFGSGANLFHIESHGYKRDVLGAGQKSGMYWALDPDDGATLWATNVGPGGSAGGIEWGSAVDDRSVYVAVNNSARATYTLQPDNKVQVSGGSWAALDLLTGKFKWQTQATGNNPVTGKPAGGLGALTVANHVLYAGSLSGDMVAVDADDGKVLWQFASGGSVASGPSVVNGTVYWGSGYSRFNFGTKNNKLYAFTVDGY